MATRTRLAPEDWIDAGFAALLQNGAAALRAEALARQVGASKGSFYWHFDDVPAFHAALLRRWEEAARAVCAASMDAPTPALKLRALAQAIATPAKHAPDADRAALDCEAAIRGWATGGGVAAAALARVDADRLARLKQALAALGVTNPEFAHVCLMAATGMAVMEDGATTGDPIGSLVDLILALSER